MDVTRSPKQTLLVADDNELMIGAICRVLRERFDLIGTVSDGVAAIGAVLALRPDAIVLDIQMPLMDGIQVVREIKKLQVGSKIVMLTASCDEDYIQAALTAGADGFVFKHKMHADLAIAVQKALDGGVFVSRKS